MSKVYDWFEERLEIQSIADDITSKYVPPHVNIFYCLGGITFTCFLVQVATGFAMTFYYRPTVAEAFASVQYIMTDVNFGWLIRSVHRWSASMMVLMMILHVFRVYLTGGFKKPRELTWVTGVIMAVCTVSFGVTGYSLPWDQIGYWAVKIVTGCTRCNSCYWFWFSRIITWWCWCWSININTFLQFTYICITISNCSIYAYALLNDS